mgnify:CR=1 FL=1
MSRTLSVGEMFEALRSRLALDWPAQSAPLEARHISSKQAGARPALVGYLNLIHPNQIQVIGREEVAHLDTLEARLRWAKIAEVMSHQPLCLIIADRLAPPDDLQQAATEAGIPLLRSPRSSYELVSYLHYYLSRALARRTTLHGVFMEVFTIGVLISGEAGCGKSELALELLTRNHRLIADDAPEFTQISPEIIDGSCPPALQDCLEVRGLGVLNVRQMFGDSAIKANKFLRLIVHLHVPEAGRDLRAIDRLRGDMSTRRVIDLDIPQITIPVLAGRNLAVITEAAVRDFMLKMKGIDAAADFVQRHALMMRS